MRSFGVQYQEGTNNTKQIQSSLRTLSSALHGGTARKGNKLRVSPLRLWQSWPRSPGRHGRVEPGGGGGGPLCPAHPSPHQCSQVKHKCFKNV